MAARLLLVLAFLGVAACGGTQPESAEPPSVVELVGELEHGGYVLYLRHAATDMSQEDTHKTDVSRCDGMRNLTDVGREQARALGRAFRELRIPVASVRASAYCRTRETARLAFGRVTRDELLTGFPDPGQPEYDERLAATRALLGRRPPPGQNVVLVGHVKNLEAAADLTIAEGELAVFEPDGGGRFRYRGRVPAPAWPDLAKHLTRGP